MNKHREAIALLAADFLSPTTLLEIAARGYVSQMGWEPGTPSTENRFLIDAEAAHQAARQ